MIDALVDHPWTPYGAAGLVVLLALLGWFRSRRRAADDLIDDDIYTAPAREREPAHDPAPSSPFNFDLELEAKPQSAAPNTSENLAPHDGPELGDAPPPSDYEVRLNLAEELWDMGQHNTARALAEEVVREASGDIQRKAQRWLNQHQA